MLNSVFLCLEGYPRTLHFEEPYNDTELMTGTASEAVMRTFTREAVTGSNCKMRL